MVSSQSSDQGDQCSSRSSCETAGKDGAGCSSCSSRNKQNDPMAEQDRFIAGTLGQIRHVLFVMSGKGGVGKSSVAVNVAAGLAAKGHKVGILDVDLHGPSVPNLLGLRDGLDMDEEQGKLLPAEYLPNLHVVSIDSLLRNKDTAILWRGPKKTAAIRQFLSDVAWNDLDFLVVDSPPGTGDEHMTLLKAIPHALSVVVTTPQELSLADVRKAMNFLQHASGRVIGVVENMSGLLCPHCGNSIPLFLSGGGKALAENYNVPFLGAVALDPITVIAADRGMPVVLMKEDSRAKTDFLRIAEAIAHNAANGIFTVMQKPENEE